MPLLRDRVRETTTTVGTGTITLGGAVTGYQSFNTAFTNGDTTYYVIQGGTEWEIGIGTIGAGTLARTTVLQSSNADALVPFAAGTKDVFCSYVADRAVTTSDAATLTNKTLDDYTNNVGANSTHFRIKATGTISKGQVVKATGFTPGESAIEVAVVTSATDLALGIAEQALTAGQFGLAVVIGELFDVNTNGLSVGAIIYSNGTGGYTTTKPSSGTYQPLGWVVRANLNNGVIAVNIVAPLYVETSTNTANTAVLRDGSGNFSAGTITATLNGAAPAGSLTGTTLASNVVSSSLTSVGTLSSLTVSGNLTVDSGTLFVDSATNRVGVGTNTPTNALDVQGAGTGFSGYARFNNFSANPANAGVYLAAAINGTTQTNWLIGAQVNINNGFEITPSTAAGGTTFSTPSIAVLNTGNVGIGTTSPVAQLANTNVTDGISAANASGFAWRSTANEWAGVIISRPASGLTYGLRVHAGGTSASDYPLWISSGAGSGTGLMAVTGAGNVGIGTTSPATRLHVDGADGVRARISATSGGTPGLSLSSAGVTNWTLKSGNGDSSLRIDQDGTDRLTIAGGGNVGIGTTSPSVALHVARGAALNAYGYFAGGNRAAALATIYGQDSGGAAYVWNQENKEIQFGTNNVGRWQINSAGNFLAATDASFDIGASGANRPRNLFLSGNTTIGGNLTVDTNTLFVNSASDRVGIGTTTPSSPLEIAALSQAVSTGNAHLNLASTDTAAADLGGVLVFSANTTPSAKFPVASISGRHQTLGAGNYSGYLQFATTSAGGGIAERMRIDASGNLLVGKTAASVGTNGAQFLTTGFSGVSASNTTAFFLNRNGSDGTVMEFGRESDSRVTFGVTSQSLTIGTGGSERMRLDASGNLGLGVTPKSWAASFRVLETAQQPVFGTTGIGNALIGSNWYNDGADRYGANGAACRFFLGSGSFSWQTAASGTAGNTISFTTAMTLDASGNLGLGVTPSAWSSGKAVEVGANGTAIWSVSAVDAYWTQGAYFNTSFRYSHTGAGGVSAYQQASGTHKWYIAAGGTAGNAITFTQAMTLDASGNLGIGVTTPGQILDMGRSVNGNTIASLVNSNTGTAAAAYFSASNGTTSTNCVHLGTAYTTVGAFEANSGGIWAVGANGGFMVASNATGSLRFSTGGYTTRWQINSSGHLLAGADASYDIGASGANRPRNVFVATSVTLADSATISSPDNFSIRDTSSSIARFSFSTANVYNTRTAGTHQFQTAGTERVRVKAEGQVRFVPLAAAPTTNVEDGDVYYDSSTNKLRVRAGGAWVDLH